MQEHILVALKAGSLLEVTGAATLDLDPASGFLLDVLHIASAMANNLSTKIESRNRLKSDRDLFLGPFTLRRRLAWAVKNSQRFE